ncbi:MAG TPA: hypothetical protein VHE35_26175 [Kofleriaceae bacterium]|nr:hypothetical protein [Kofleriaceae bacterium]
MRRLAFSPSKHGFHFVNTFVNHVSPGITTSGLCGGMALAAARYWLARVAIPTHVPDDFPDGSPAGVPPEGSPLQRYIYDCQLASYGPLGVASALNWVTMPWITLADQFNWSVAEFDNVRRAIDSGIPTVLGLRRVSGGPFGHQVLAYGYDEADHRIFVYDPNFPDVEKCLRLDLGARTIVYDGAGSPAWSSYFVTGCPMEGPAPTYVDLDLRTGLTVTAGDPVAAGGPVTVDVRVENFGFRDAHVAELFVYVRGPRGENLDGLLGAGDGDGSPIAPGAGRTLHRTGHLGTAPGLYTIGVSYRSQQNEWISLPARTGGTRGEVQVRVVDATRSPAMPWRSLGGILTSPPAAAANADGRLEVFGRGTDDRMWHLGQNAAGGSDFGGWELMPGDTTFAGGPAVGLNHWRKLELFARGRDRAMYHRWQNEVGTRSAAQWSGWTARGGSLDADPTVARNRDDRLEVFAVHTDGRVYHMYQRWFDPFGAPWSGWEAMGSRRFTGRVAVECDGSGCLWALARSRDDQSIWSCRQTSPGGSWTDWQPTNGAGDEPALACNADGRLEAFVRGTDGRIWHLWQQVPGGALSSWELLHDQGPVRPVLGAGARPTAWNQGDRSLAVVAVESDREAFLIARTNVEPWWSDYQLVGSEVSSDVAAASGGGTTGLFALGPARDLRVLLRRP